MVRVRDLGKAAVAGLLGGLAGAWAMSQFSRLWERSFPASSGSPAGSRVIQFGSGGRPRPHMHASQQEWDSTLHAATAVARRVLQMPINDAQRERGAVAVHYAVGAGMGAAYGLMCEYLPETAAGLGAGFGAAVWLIFEEAGMPVLGWTRPPLKYSAAQHVNSLGEHLAYGVTTELVRRVFRRAR